MDLDDLLGIDKTDPVQRLAGDQSAEDQKLLDDLIARRRLLGLSQTEVAARLGVSQSAIAKIESGDRDPRLSTLRRYALALGVLVRHRVTPTIFLDPESVTVADRPDDERVVIRGGNRPGHSIIEFDLPART